MLPARAAAEDWVFRGAVAGGTQFDAVSGPDATLHLVSDHYVRLDGTGTALLNEAIGDAEQSPMLHAPAIAVDPDGTVHLVTRDGGNFDAGYTLRYHRRHPTEGWGYSHAFDSPVQWNWQVGVASDEQGTAYLMSTRKGGNVWADLRLFEATDAGVTELGDIAGWYRVDNSALLRGRSGVIALAAGDNSQPTRLGVGAAGPGLLTTLMSGAEHAAGSGSDHGFPCVYLDDSDGIHFSYGSGFTNHDQFPAACPSCVAGEVHYNRYDENGGAVFAGDRTVITGLDTWHLSIGMSAVAATDNGVNVVIAALKTHDSKEGFASTLITSFSTDGGETWSPQLNTGRSVNAGEGRLRPRLVALGSDVHLLYVDNAAPGQISMATMAFPPDPEVPTPGDGGGDDDGEMPSSEDGDESDGGGTGGDDSDSATSAGPADPTSGVIPATTTFGAADADTGCSCRSDRPHAPVWLGLLVLASLRRRRPVQSLIAKNS